MRTLSLARLDIFKCPVLDFTSTRSWTKSFFPEKVTVAPFFYFFPFFSLLSEIEKNFKSLFSRFDSTQFAG